MEHLPSLEDQVVRQQSGRRHTGLRLGLGPVAFAAIVSVMLLAVPLAAQGPADPRFCRVEAAPANQPASDIGDIAVSGQAVSGQTVLERADTDGMYFIDILFFYTDGFADDFTRLGRSMSDEIRKSVNLANAALANSKVNATVRIVGVEQLPGMPDDQDAAVDMILVDDHAAARRNALEADLVYALVDDPDGYLGVACQPSSEADFGYGRCFWGSINSCGAGNVGCGKVWRATLRHEVGHSLGIQHSPQLGGDPDRGFYPGAVGYTPEDHGGNFGTVMGGNTLPRFSTSSETFDFGKHRNLVVGEPGVHEASTALPHSIGPVSRYRPLVTMVSVNAGADDSVDSGGTVPLDSTTTVTNPNGATTYAWRRVSGTGGGLSSVSAEDPTFAAPTLAAGASNVEIVWRLTSTNNGVSASDDVTVTVRAPAAPATTVSVEAGAAADVASGGERVLDATVKVANGSGATTYAWRRVSGTGGGLSSVRVEDPTFTAPTLTEGAANRTIVWRLVATNNGVSASDTVSVTVLAPSVVTAVSVDAGDDASVASGGTVLLDSTTTVTDPHGATTYAWRRVSGSGGGLSSVRVEDPTFTAPTLTEGAPNRTIVWRLVATNNGVSASDTVSVTVLAPSVVTAVSVDAGDDASVASGGTVLLDSTTTVTDPHGATTYAWRRVSGSGGGLSSVRVEDPTFTAPTLAAGASNVEIVWRLTSTNNGVSASDDVTVTVRAPAAPATTVSVEAGAAADVASGGERVLDATVTVANGFGVTTYAWRRVSGSGGGLSSVRVEDPTFTAPTLTEGAANRTIVWRLVATNNGVSASDTVSVTVTAGDDNHNGDNNGDNDDGDGGGDDGNGDSPPTALFTATAQCSEELCKARTGVPVTFKDVSTGNVAVRNWDFGDGRKTSDNETVDHAWASPGFHDVTLRVSDGATASTAFLKFLVEASDSAGTCVADSETMCLQDSRFSVALDWWTSDGDSGAGKVVHEGTNDSGLFRFFDRNNWEILIKVLNGCALNEHVWVYGASATTLGYSVRVTDTVTGQTRNYRNEPGERASAITDSRAFPETCDVGAAAASSPATAPSRIPVTAEDNGGYGGCKDTATTICLQGGRYEVSVGWSTLNGEEGKAGVLRPRTDNSGLFYFFSSDNWEMLVKVLDGCGYNGRHWVFAASATDAGLDLRVRDTVAGMVRRYTREPGEPASALADINAFPDGCQSQSEGP